MLKTTNYKEKDMKTKLKYKLTALLMSTALLISCSANTTTQTPVSSETETKNVELNIKTMSQNLVEYDDDDYYSDWEEQNPVYINLNTTTAEVTGSGAKVDGNTVTITAAGTYVLSGTLDGQIVIDDAGKGTVRIILNGADISCSDSSPIYVKSAEKVVLSLAKDTQNSVTDGSSYELAEGEDEPNAAIFSKDDLTVNGSGTLTVNANYNNGIAGKDDLKVTGGTIIINSVDDGILGKDLVAVKDSHITINAKGDGIKSTNDTDADKGNIVLESGTFEITAGSSGLQAEKELIIFDGEFNITSTVDSIHSNSTVAIYGGNITINAEDDGIHADASIDISGGTIEILNSYEGIESAVVNISGGSIRLNAQDDGINVAGGKDSSSVTGRPGQDTFAASSDYKLSISGGNIYVNASGDGLDANGSIYMSGGTVIVDGPTSSGNGSLDYDSAFEITGGLLIAAGSAGMVQTPSSSSSQNSVLVVYSQLQKAGTLVNIQDGSGKSIASYAPSKDYQAVLVSSPDLALDAAYQLFTGGTSTGSSTNGLYADGDYENGTKTADFTLTKNVLSISETGSEVTAGGFGPGGRGGKMMPGTDGQMPADGQRPQRPDGQMPQMPERTAPDGTSGATQKTTESSGSDDTV